LADKTYQVQIEIRAWRELMRLGEDIQNAIFDAIEHLEQEPRPSGCKKLVAETTLYRVRIGKYRVTYRIEDDVLVVVVVKVGHRSQIYKKKK